MKGGKKKSVLLPFNLPNFTAVIIAFFEHRQIQYSTQLAMVIQRVTLFKVSSPGDISKILAEYEKIPAAVKVMAIVFADSPSFLTTL